MHFSSMKTHNTSKLKSVTVSRSTWSNITWSCYGNSLKIWIRISWLSFIQIWCGTNSARPMSLRTLWKSQKMIRLSMSTCLTNFMDNALFVWSKLTLSTQSLRLHIRKKSQKLRLTVHLGNHTESQLIQHLTLYEAL